MHVNPDLYRWYPNVDPDFDELGGELTLHQIADPLPECEGKAWQYRSYKRARDRARYQKQVETLQAAKQAAFQQIIESRRRLTEFTYRFDRAARYLNRACRGCIPYSGSNTPYYWHSGRAPFRVEDFLK